MTYIKKTDEWVSKLTLFHSKQIINKQEPFLYNAKSAYSFLFQQKNKTKHSCTLIFH